MRKFFVHIILFTFFVVNGTSANVAERVQAWVQKKRQELPYSLAPGISAVVFPPGNEQAFAFGNGVQTLGKEKLADKDTLMEIGSLSKTFIALGISALVTKNILKFDDTVRKHLGKDYMFSPDDYVSRTLTVKDLMAHRTGLAEGQGDFMGYLIPAANMTNSLGTVDPIHSLREIFDYSNTGWTVAGEVFRAAANATSWCNALRTYVLQPLNLTRTYCHRNEIPNSIAQEHLASVHKMDPCARHHVKVDAGKVRNGFPTPPPLATFEFIKTGRPEDFAWGAADAAGSVISSMADMKIVLSLILGRTSNSTIFSRPVLDYIQQGQMTVPIEWMGECGIAPTIHGVGQGAAAGLGFDLATNVNVNLNPSSSHSQQFPYVEKNGDTNMHKARLGLLPASKAGVLFVSNLGGSMGCQLTALKWGVLSLLAGSTEETADNATQNALLTTDFMNQQWLPGSTCNACKRADISGTCSPSGLPIAPFDADAAAGHYDDVMFGPKGVTLSVGEDTAKNLLITLGPCVNCKLTFSPTSFALVNRSCSDVADAIPLNSWAKAKYGKKLSTLGNGCTAAEFILAPEIKDAGISVQNGTVAFPWGCGAVPLPDGISIIVVTHQGKGQLITILGEASWRS